jgi:hypothetical protein
VLSDDDPVDHQAGDLEPGQVAVQQLLERLAGLGDEPAADRRLRRRPCLLLDLGADRLAGRAVAAGRQPGQHPLHDDLAEQVVGGERGGGVQLHLVPVTTPGAGPLDRHAPAAEHHRPRRRAMSAGGPVGVVLALGAHLGFQLGLQQLAHDSQSHRHTHGQQPLPGGGGHLGHRQAHLLGQIGQQGDVLALHKANTRYLLHGGPLPSGRLGGRPTPTTRQVSGGDRHLNFNKPQDNLPVASASR